MSDWTRKTRHAGPPVRDKRKVVPEPPKHGHKPKPKDYGLRVRMYVSYYTEEVHKFASAKARDQYRAMAEQRAKNDRKGHWRWYKDYKSTPEFEEIDG